MPIVGFNFDKILVERIKPVEGQVKVKRNLSIKDIKKQEIVLSPKKKEEILKCNFDFSVDYEPGLGKILIEGHILFIDEPAEIKKLFDGWKKNKELPVPIMTLLLNTALVRSNIKALSLIQDVNLPPHMQLPTINPKSKASDYIG
ncbi:MAG: hypothetical protein ABIH63_02735 [archaeon]